MNVFHIPDNLPQENEFFEELVNGNEVRVERIISHGHTTPEGEWYDQDTDEWVVLLQGESTLEWRDGSQIQLAAGDALFIPAHCRHRVSSTTENPPCIWLAIHGNLQRPASREENSES